MMFEGTCTYEIHINKTCKVCPWKEWTQNQIWKIDFLRYQHGLNDPKKMKIQTALRWNTRRRFMAATCHLTQATVKSNKIYKDCSWKQKTQNNANQILGFNEKHHMAAMQFKGLQVQIWSLNLEQILTVPEDGHSEIIFLAVFRGAYGSCDESHPKHNLSPDLKFSLSIIWKLVSVIQPYGHCMGTELAMNKSLDYLTPFQVSTTSI